MLRYSEIARKLPDAKQKVLTETLREMERYGVVTRTIYPTIPPKVEYALTPVGTDLLKLLHEFRSWLSTNEVHIKRSRTQFDSSKSKKETERAI